MAENLKKITKMPRLCCKKQGRGLHILCKYAPKAGGGTPAARYSGGKAGRRFIAAAAARGPSVQNGTRSGRRPAPAPPPAYALHYSETVRRFPPWLCRRLQCEITTIRSNQTTLSAVKLPLLL